MSCPAPLPRPRAVLFDAYGTLFDVHSVVLRAEQFFPGQGQALSSLWRDKQIEYTRLVNSQPTHYRPFWELTRAALEYAIIFIANKADSTRGSTPFDRQSVAEQLMNEYRHLSAFPENREVLQRLYAAGIPTGILSNGDPDMLGIAVRSAGLEDCLSAVISVDSVRRYKTDPKAYALGPSRLGLPARDILFVSSNGWDALGAGWAGHPTLWVNRHGLPAETLTPPPTAIGTSLRDVWPFFF